MENEKGKKLIIGQIILLIFQALASLAGNFIHQRFMSDGASITIKKFNFISPMTWGYGNIFPILFILSILLLAIILINALVKNNYSEDKLSSNIVSFGSLLFLMAPLLIGVQQINIGLMVIETVQFIVFAINMVRTRS